MVTNKHHLRGKLSKIKKFERRRYRRRVAHCMRNDNFDALPVVKRDIVYNCT